jgi:hypothetical protein
MECGAHKNLGTKDSKGKYRHEGDRKDRAFAGHDINETVDENLI